MTDYDDLKKQVLNKLPPVGFVHVPCDPGPGAWVKQVPYSIPPRCWFMPRADGPQIQFTPPPFQVPQLQFHDVRILQINPGMPVEALLADGFKLTLTPRINAVRVSPTERTPEGHPVYQIDAELIPHLEPVLSMHVPQDMMQQDEQTVDKRKLS